MNGTLSTRRSFYWTVYTTVPDCYRY